jgi:quercetin dioxygenase-like cupin family protein/pyrroloquinoline quinone (PQQ) biosynthesis protein C
MRERATIIPGTSREWEEHPRSPGLKRKPLLSLEVDGVEFSCSLVRAEEGAEVAEHVHEREEDIAYVLSGRATLSIGGEERELHEGMVVRIPAGIPHRIVNCREGFQVLSLFLSPRPRGRISKGGETMVAVTKKLELGQKLTPEQAKEIVDALYERMHERARAVVGEGRYMRALKAGTLPFEGIKVFWQNWYGFVAEINNFIGCAYQFHLPFFKRNWDLLGPFSAKVADELIHPKPPGHVEIVIKQGEIFGLRAEEMIEYEMLPECRALVEWHRGVLHEGTMAEFWASIAWEEYVGHWAREFREALLSKYGLKEDQVPYFVTHEEADLEEHEGVMGHGEFNRAVLQRILQEGRADFRPGFSLEYAALTSVDLFALFLEGVYRHVMKGES